MNGKKIYLDYASTTPVDKEVLLAMEPYFSEKFGNPNSLHSMGQDAMRAVDDSRETIKNFLNAGALREIIFTGSATEANNFAIQGLVNYGPPRSVVGPRRSDKLFHGRRASVKEQKPHIITTNIEHHSVLDPVKQLEKQGKIEATYIKANKVGLIDPQDIKSALKENTILVSIMYANNEIGTIQPIAEIANIIRNFRNSKHEAQNSKQYLNSKSKIQNKKVSNFGFRISDLTTARPLLHTDAVQAAQFLEMDVQELGVDMLTISAHKMYGPKGVGALYVKDGIKLAPIMQGGGQEYGLRPGTQNVPLIVGMAKAVEIISRENPRENPREKIKDLRDYTIDKILKEIPGTQLNGAREPRLPNNINILFENIDSDRLRIGLAERGICVSSGAACSSRAQEASHVIQALGRTKKQAHQSLRITLGKQTTKQEIDFFLKTLYNI